MSERKLSPEEIELIYDFCYDRGVSEYEIQSELVDHLASAIEDRWKESPDLSFFDNLFGVYRQFGHFGFKKIVKSKKVAFRRQYNRLLIKFLGSFFLLPRIMLTLVLGAFLFILVHFFDAREPVMFGIMGFSLALYLWYILVFFPKWLTVKVKKEQKFLFLNYINTLKAVSNLLILCLINAVNICFRHFAVPNYAWFDLGLSFAVVFLFILGYALMFYMPTLTNRHFKEQFPQFVAS